MKKPLIYTMEQGPMQWLIIENASEDHKSEVWIQYIDAKGRFHRLAIDKSLTIRELHDTEDDE